jgi:hypothetical protein
MRNALKLATLVPRMQAPESKDRAVRPFVGSAMPVERLQLADAPVLEPFNPDRGFGVRGRFQGPDTDPAETKQTRRRDDERGFIRTVPLTSGTVSFAGRRQTGASRESRHAYTHCLA